MKKQLLVIISNSMGDKIGLAAVTRSRLGVNPGESLEIFSSDDSYTGEVRRIPSAFANKLVPSYQEDIIFISRDTAEDLSAKLGSVVTAEVRLSAAPLDESKKDRVIRIATGLLDGFTTADVLNLAPDLRKGYISDVLRACDDFERRDGGYYHV